MTEGANLIGFSVDFMLIAIKLSLRLGFEFLLGSSLHFCISHSLEEVLLYDDFFDLMKDGGIIVDRLSF